MNAAFDKYLTANRLWSMEGDSGVRKFEQVVRDVCGYRDLQTFLADNPGALTAMMDFVGEWVERNQEWKDNLEALGFAGETEEGEDDE